MFQIFTLRHTRNIGISEARFAHKVSFTVAQGAVAGFVSRYIGRRLAIVVLHSSQPASSLFGSFTVYFAPLPQKPSGSNSAC